MSQIISAIMLLGVRAVLKTKSQLEQPLRVFLMNGSLFCLSCLCVHMRTHMHVSTQVMWHTFLSVVSCYSTDQRVAVMHKYMLQCASKDREKKFARKHGYKQ